MSLKIFTRSVVYLLLLLPVRPMAAATLATDHTSYNVGSMVMVRFVPGTAATATVRYAGGSSPLSTGVRLEGSDYQKLWTIPSTARTGRYEIDLKTEAGVVIRSVAGFAVHRQLAKVISFDLDKTFYTSGDQVNPRIVVQNVSDHALNHLQVEFENYTYPWIAPAADEARGWKTVAASSLSLAPGETREFRLTKAAVVQARADRQTYIYFSAVIRDSEDPDRIYDLAFAPPAITAPFGGGVTKTYPALYLYETLKNVPASEAYRQFYPPAYVSDALIFNTRHTMFRSHVPLAFSFAFHPVEGKLRGARRIKIRVLDRTGKQLASKTVNGAAQGDHDVAFPGLEPGLYTLEVAAMSQGGLALETSRLDFAVNDLPKSLLVFCAHEDDDTAHPEIIRAAVENDVPVHVVYFTSGDAGGCDRYYMHSCDASRAMDFGEVRMAEARASLGHLGVPADNISFLGLPDGGMEQIWAHSASAAPYLSVLLASDHSPYAGAAIPNLAYSRDAVIAATESFISKYHPDLIITGHPEERHVDHRTNNWFVAKAMQNLLRQGLLADDTQLIVDQVYGPDPRIASPYHYEKTEFYVSGEVAKLGQEASWYYQTQDGNHQQAEIVAYDKLARDASPPHFGQYHWPYPHYRILDWQQHAGWNDR